MSASALKSIEIALRANVTNFRSGIGLAAGDVKRFGQDLKQVGDSSDRDLKKVGQAAMIAGGAMLAGFGLATKAVVGFDQKISELGAVTGEAGAGLESLRQAAMKAGADTVFSASQAAQAEVELAKAGVSTADILHGALGGALNLASAGHLELGRAAEISASAMTMFKLQGRDVPHIADLLAAGANKSAAEVEDMGAALQQSGLVASQLGLSVEDTTAALAMFAQWGLKGSDAGTSLKTMLIALNPKSEEAAQTMEGLGLKFYDAQGKFVGVRDMAEQLKTKLGGLTEEQRNSALMTIFGTDAIRAAGIVYSEGGAGVDDWRTKVDDAGYASELAAKKMDNLGGDLEQLKGSLETTLIGAGSGATGVLRGLTQETTQFVNGLGTLPAGMQQVTMGFVGITGAVLALGGGLAVAVPKYKGMIESLGEMGPAGVKAGKGVSFASNALMVAAPGLIAGTMLWGSIQHAADEAYKTFTRGWKVPTSFRESSDQINKQIAEMERLKKVGDGPIWEELYQNLNPFTDDVIAEAQEGSKRFEKAINDALPGHKNWEDANRQLQHSLGLTQDEVDALAQKLGVDLTGKVEETVPALQRMKRGLDEGTPASQTLGAGLDGLKDKTKSVKEKFDDFTNSMKAMFDTAYGLGSAQDQLQSKLNALPAIVAAVQWNFNGTTEAAIAYRNQMRGIGEDSSKVVQEWVRQGIQGEELKGRIDWLTVGILAQGTAWGIPKAEIDKYLTPLHEVANTPDLTTNVTANTAAAANDLTNIQNQKAGVGQPVTIPVQVDTSKVQAKVNEALAIFAKAFPGSPVNLVDFRQAGLKYAKAHGGYGVLSDEAIMKLGMEHPNGYASGTSHMADGAFMVGERGPELGFKQGSNVSILDAGRTRTMFEDGSWRGMNAYERAAHDYVESIQKQEALRAHPELQGRPGWGSLAANPFAGWAPGADFSQWGKPQTRQLGSTYAGSTWGTSSSPTQTIANDHRVTNINVTMPNYLGDKRQAAREIAQEIKTIHDGWSGN